jgi:hypothetical protein
VDRWRASEASRLRGPHHSPVSYLPFIEWLPTNGDQHGIVRLFVTGVPLASDGIPATGFVWSAVVTKGAAERIMHVRAALTAPPARAMPILLQTARDLDCTGLRWERLKGGEIVVREFGL